MPKATGYLQEFNTLSQATMPFLEQKFYEIENLMDFVNIDNTGEYMDTLVRGRTRMHSKRFVGFRNGSQGLAKSPSTNVSRDMFSIKNHPWMETIEWSEYELEQASRGLIPYDVLAEKVTASKKSWDLDKQDAIFAGVNFGEMEISGLLNIDGIAKDLSLIPSGKMIKNLSEAEMKNFIAAVLDVYSDNSKIKAFPDTFIVPFKDYVGWGVPFAASSATGSSGVTVNRTILNYLLETFKEMTQNPGFKILPVAYAEASNMKEYVGENVNRYMLYKKNDDSLKFHVPQELRQSNIVQTTGTTFTMSVYGQIAGISCGHPENILYMDAGV